MRYGHFVMSLFCAWVLWGKAGPVPFVSLDIFKSEQECRQRLETLSAIESGMDAEKRGSYLCLSEEDPAHRKENDCSLHSLPSLRSQRTTCYCRRSLRFR